MTEFELSEIKVGSGEYGELVGLRFEELRKPLGMQWTAAEMAADQKDRHFGLGNGEECLGVVVVAVAGEGSVKFRQIAIKGDRQGEGLGRILMEKIEAKMRGEGVVWATLNARQTVAGFYEALGYAVEGREFQEIGLAHVKMRKSLKGGSA